MGSRNYLQAFVFGLIIGISSFVQCMSTLLDTNAILTVNASQGSARKMPDNLFGVSFEEINHAGAGGLWGELVSNRGFESGGRHTPAHIDPWSVIGDYSLVRVVTDLSSCFKTNPVALRMEVLCDTDGVNACPVGGVGIHNPGYWGMNIEQGKTYKLILYIRSLDSVDVVVSLTDTTGVQTLATTNITATDVSNWQKMEIFLKAIATNHNSRLQFKTNKKGVIWFDQVSLMPMDTYKGHGFRNDLFRMVANLKPGFIRFPGGDFAQGKSLINGYWWKDTIGPWEQRPGHLNDVWQYWTDDGLGYFEFLQLAEDLGASPIWVFNSGFSQNEGVNPSNIQTLVQDALDGIEFARGDPNSTWGSVRAAMGHTEPFNLKHVAIGNQNCGRASYRDNYLKFYTAITKLYPDIKLVSNCDGSNSQLDHPANLYDYHVYVNANTMFSMARTFDRTSRIGPKAFVSEYAVTGNGGLGNLLAALAEAGFLIGIEKNSDVVDMASNAPLFLNANTPSDKGFRPDAIVFDSYRIYGTPSYWMQQFFSMSNGAILLDSTLQTNTSNSLTASAIWFQNKDNKNYLRVKVVNYGNNKVNLRISFDGLNPGSIDYSRSSKTVLSSTNVMDENSFKTPTKVSPVKSLLKKFKNDMNVILSPYSLTSFDLLIASKNIAHLNAIYDNSCVSI
ncbi:alpha-L-arabinofuranosidase 1-like [Rutidosis leptorrhynchoides]|uniref:alpha-L-arabinofuranosidase 1-like n=1 Tax=Rutidosis leptorrhynchoides TaxID=125765 RepID=UPI003A99A6AF